MKKNIIAFLIVLALAVSMVPSVFAVEAASPTLTVTPSVETVAPGGTFTVTVALANNPGNVCGEVTLTASEGLSLAAVTPVLSTVEDDFIINVEGGKVAYTVLTEQTAATLTLFTATYEVAETAAEGDYTVTAAGAAFYRAYPNIDGYTVASDTATVEVAIPSGVNVTKHAGTANIEYTVDGQVVTVTHAIPCKVGYWDATQNKYVAIAAVASGNSYTFTVPTGVTDVILVVKGDATGDGRVNAGDCARIKAAALGTATMTQEQTFAGDATGDNRTNAGDCARIKAAALGSAVISW